MINPMPIQTLMHDSNRGEYLSPNGHNYLQVEKQKQQVVPGTTNPAHLRHKVILGIKFKFDTSLT